jgi:hypothetical protein
VIADLVDGVIQSAQGFGDARSGCVAGQVDGCLQAEPDTEQAVDDPVEQLLAPVRLPGDSGPGKIREIPAAPDLGGILCVPETARTGRATRQYCSVST